jgi:hypothetical protein
MATASGFASKAAYAAETSTTYGTVIAAGAGDLLPYTSENVVTDIAHQDDFTLTGIAGIAGSDPVSNKSTGPVTFELTYGNSLQQILTHVFGFEAYDQPTNPAGSDYKHIIELDDDLAVDYWKCDEGITSNDGQAECGDQRIRRGTLIFDKSVSLWELASVMWEECTISGQAGQKVTMEVTGFPRSLDRASSTNTSSSSWTNSDDGGKVVFSDLTFRMDDYSASVSLSAADNLAISSFELRIKNNLVTDEQTTSSGLFISEPSRGNRREVELTFTMPRYNSTNDAFLDDFDADTIQMATLNFDSGTDIGGGNNYQFEFQLGSLKVMESSANVDDPGLTDITFTLKALLPAGEPSGFETDTKNNECVLVLYNGDSTNYLK